METLLTEGLTVEDMEISKLKREKAEMVVTYGLEYWLEEYHRGSASLLTSIKNAHYLLSIKGLDEFQRQKKLGAFVEEVLTKGKGEGADIPPFNRLCYQLVELFSKEGFPKSGESKNETAFERAAQIIVGCKYKKKCAPKTVRNAWEDYPKKIH